MWSMKWKQRSNRGGIRIYLTVNDERIVLIPKPKIGSYSYHMSYSLNSAYPPLLTHIVVPYIFPYIAPFKKFRL